MKINDKIKFSLFALFFAFILIASPQFAFAQDYGVKAGLGKINGLFPKVQGLNQNSTVGDVFVYVIKIALGIAFAIAVLFVIYGGYQYITSGGNEEQATKGKKTLIYAVIGIVVIILSFVIISVITNLVQSGSSGSGGNYNANIPPPPPPPP